MTAQLMIYLAGPMDDVAKNVAQGWRRELARAFPAVLFFDPTRAYHNASSALARSVDYTNRHAINVSDGVIANLAGPGRGFGTIREVEFARRQGKPVAVAGDVVSLLVHDLIVRLTLEEAMQALLEAITDEINRPSFLFGPVRIDLPGDDDE